MQSNYCHFKQSFSLSYCRDLLVSGALIHVNPFIRFESYLIGLIWGYFYASQKLPPILFGNKLTMKTIILFCTIILYLPLLYTMNEWQKYVYLTIYRNIWSIGVVFLIIYCQNCSKGIIKYFFESNLFLPLSRLSFPVFIFHFSTLALTSFALQRIADYDGLMAYFILFGSFALTIFVSLLFTVIFGLPLFNLINLYKKQRATL